METQRQHPRFAHEAALTIRADEVVHRGNTTNLSRGGLCATFADVLPVGMDVVIDIQLVFEHDSRSESLQLQARVVWCTTVDSRHQVGFSFQRLQPEQIEYLALFLRYLDHATSERIRAKHTDVDDRFS